MFFAKIPAGIPRNSRVCRFCSFPPVQQTQRQQLTIPGTVGYSEDSPVHRTRRPNESGFVSRSLVWVTAAAVRGLRRSMWTLSGSSLLSSRPLSAGSPLYPPLSTRLLPNPLPPSATHVPLSAYMYVIPLTATSSLPIHPPPALCPRLPLPSPPPLTVPSPRPHPAASTSQQPTAPVGTTALLCLHSLCLHHRCERYERASFERKSFERTIFSACHFSDTTFQRLSNTAIFNVSESRVSATPISATTI